MRRLGLYARVGLVLLVLLICAACSPAEVGLPSSEGSSCEPDDRSCEGNWRVRCDEDGTWVRTFDCEVTDQRCFLGRCVEKIVPDGDLDTTCSPGEFSCRGADIYRCEADETWEFFLSCARQGYGCRNGLCVKPEPSDGDVSDGDAPDGDTPADGDDPDGDEPDGDEPDGDTPTPVCGNGNLESGEECENTDHCTGGKTCDPITCECKSVNPPVCGNTILESGEECENNSHCTGGTFCNPVTCACEEMQALLCNKIPADVAPQLCLIFNGTYTLQADAETCGACTAFAAMTSVSLELTDCAGDSYGTINLDPITAGTDWVFLLELDEPNVNVSFSPIESPNTCADVTYDQFR